MDTILLLTESFTSYFFNFQHALEGVSLSNPDRIGSILCKLAFFGGAIAINIAAWKIREHQAKKKRVIILGILTMAFLCFTLVARSICIKDTPHPSSQNHSRL